MSKVHPMRFALLATVAGAAMLQAGAAIAADDSIVTQRADATQVAQAAPAATAGAGGDVLEEIIVSGFRQSIQASLEQKRNATQIVEVITAEDIGKLPDNSIAESIARLPGLAAQRVDGRASVISLRGLGPDFTATLLNGREQVSTGNNRGVEFDQYPAEISSGVAVYKTSQSNVIGQGLAGTVDLKTIRPLDYKDRVVALSARSEYVTNGKLNSDSKEIGYRFSGTYVDRFANDTLGLSIGVSHLNQPTQIKSARFWGDGNYPRINDSQPLSDTAPYIIGGGEFRANSQTLKRTGVVATVQYEPTDSFATSLDFFYSKFDDVQYQRGVELPLWWSGAVLAPTGRTVQNGLVTAGSFSGVKGVGRSDIRETEADLYSAGWNGKYTKDAWTVTADLGYSSADRQSSRFEAYYGTGRNGTGATDTVGFTSTPNDFGWQLTHNLNYADPNLMLLTDPGGWSGGSIGSLDQNGYLNQPSIKDELYTARLDVKREIDSEAFRAVTLGVNYTDRSKSYEQPEWYIVTTANVQNPTAQRSIAVPAASVLKPTDLSWVGLGDTLAFDPRDLLDQGIYSLVKCPRLNCVDDLAYSIDEKVWTGYAQVDIDAQLGDTRLTGNFGAQYIRTDQSSTAPAINPDKSFKSVTDGIKYNNFLPNMNLIFTLPNEDHKIRLAAARQMARARPDQLSALFTYGFDPTPTKLASTDIEFSPWSADDEKNGNPKLKPWIADAIDATYEFYFADAGYLALNGYYKWLKTYIYREKSVYDFTGLPTNGTTPRLFTGYSKRPVNGNGGDIYGVELALSLPFELISEGLDGFGVTGNVGYTKTSITPDPGQPSQPIPGYSKYTAQGTFYYDKDGFQARVSANHRSKFLAEVTGFGQGRAMRMAKAETVMDAQVSYEFQEGSSLQGLTIMLQGYNLTNEPFAAYGNGDTRLIERYEEFGSRYLLGASYKF
ncbi:TonB-dependent receptor [Niveispirillum sp. KHB5.9]|uniref:TonB-dependent receptor n=1 Tax=Niveispirillum sp. KHB5.9 TaxID=3400269 RepID=UPI003A872486